MDFRHVLGVAAVIGLVAISFAALVDQSERLVGVHEVMPFSQGFGDRSPLAAWLGRGA